jgi:hypothetical protein
MSGRNNVHIVAGMDAILNPDNIKPGINLKELEQQMISNGLITERARDPSDKLNDELDIMAQKLGIPLNDFTGKKKPSSVATTNHYSTLPQQTLDADEEESSEESEDRAEENDDIEDNDILHSPAQSPTHSPTQAQNTSYATPPAQNYPQYSRPTQYSQQPYYGGDKSEFATRTYEQERRDHIDSVMGPIDSAQNFSIEKEKREDTKYAMLAEIDSLVTFLNEEQIDISRIPKVDRTSDYTEVDSVLRMLRHKNDHNRYCSFADEFLISGAYVLEELFDGKRTWFGRYNPDLTGWHNHVNVKLKRMQYDTGQIVSAAMQEYNIGPTARVALELLPSMLIYSRTRRRQHNQPNLFSDDQMADVNTRLRNS